ncbi:MAG: S8 family serine peptidase [Oscillospiraceae bacterium]|nr:S8 family serine peptidase [Oscillospiraceae bacterium]
MKKRLGKSLLSFLVSVLLLVASAPITATPVSLATDNIPPSKNTDVFGSDYIPGEVLALADSLGEAEKIAEAYNLELKSFAYGIAVFAAQSPELSVRQSQNMQTSELPGLSINRLYDAYEVNSEPYSTFIQYHHAEMDNELAWGISTGVGVVVAVIDTGIDIYHPEFAGRILATSYNSHTDQVGLDYVKDNHGHGTCVSGILAASSANNSGVYGVAPDVELLVIKADRPSDNKFEMASLLRAVNYAVENGADIINMSLGSPYSAGAVDLEQKVIANAVNKGVTVVCAAGNDRTNHAGYPAAYPEAIAVSALKQGCKFDDTYSNYGSEIDISAPGTGIYSTANGGAYTSMNGTSMACPNVAGVGALIKALHPEYTPQKIRAIICETAREAGKLGWDEYYGYGVVNAYAALLEIDALYSVTYDFRDGKREPIIARAAPGSRLLEPEQPERGDYSFQGWHISTDEEGLFDFTGAIGESITLYAHWDKPAVSEFAVFGVVKSYNPQNPTYISLIQNGVTKYTTTIASTPGFGLKEQSFGFSNIMPGVYSLEVSKKVHTKYTISFITVSNDDLDLTQDNRLGVQIITLLCGDINEDGEINQSDLNLLWSPANYNKSVAYGANLNCDLNGDSEVNQVDLNILWLSANYNKGAVIINK